MRKITKRMTMTTQRNVMTPECIDPQVKASEEREFLEPEPRLHDGEGQG
jgi:hypothetical protein